MSETNTATPMRGNWDADFPKRDDKNKGGGDRKQTVYMDLRAEGEYRVRLVGPYVVFLKHWSPIRAITHKDYEGTDPAWKAGFKPQLRYAVNVIDRADGQLKVLEAGSQVFRVFANCARVNQIDPAEKDGPDFNITVTIPMKNGRPNPRSKTYETESTLGSKPFTAEEIAMIKEKKLYPLSALYKSASLEKIQELWDEVPEDQRVPQEDENDNKYSKAKSAEAAAEAADVVEPATLAKEDSFLTEATGGEEAADLF